VRSHPNGAGYLCIVEPTSEPPEEEIRRAAAEMVTSQGQRLKRLAVVIEGSGFRAAITRSVFSGIVRFVRTPSPLRFFASAATATAWMAKGTAPGPVASLDLQIEQLRRLLAVE
jgi:hypothetical protein